MRPGASRVTNHGDRGGVVNYRELLVESGERWILAHDVMSQSVQGAHAVAELGHEIQFPRKSEQSRSEILDRRIHQRDNQNLLTGAKPPSGNQAGRECGECVCFAGAGHGRNAELAARVLENAGLRRPGSKEGGHPD